VEELGALTGRRRRLGRGRESRPERFEQRQIVRGLGALADELGQESIRQLGRGIAQAGGEPVAQLDEALSGVGPLAQQRHQPGERRQLAARQIDRRLEALPGAVGVSLVERDPRAPRRLEAGDRREPGRRGGGSCAREWRRQQENRSEETGRPHTRAAMVSLSVDRLLAAWPPFALLCGSPFEGGMNANAPTRPPGV
jgi:hypothetical protein